MDYKLTITTSKLNQPGLVDLANTILGDYGEDYDAARGDFTTDVSDGAITVLLKDVALGDARSLAENLWGTYGDGPDGLTIAASRFERGHWWPADLVEE